MKTITRIRKYRLSDKEVRILTKLGVINGCGGQGGFNFDELLLKISMLTYVDKTKLDKLRSDLKILCYDHDIDYSRGGGITNYITANREFIENIGKLLHWIKPSHLEMILAGSNLLLNIFGITYFRWSFHRKELYELYLRN